MFDAGAIIFKIQAMGAEVFKRDLQGVEQATKQAADTSKTAAKSTEDLGKKQETAAEQTRRLAKEQAAAEKKARELASAQSTVGLAMVGVGAAIAAMAAVAVSKFAEFDKAVSGTQAATHASTSDMAKLSAAAIKAGADTAYSATEAANAETELAKAGVETADVLKGGLKGSLALAAAGQLGVADAASIAATTLKQFNLTGDKTEHVADLLAAGAGKAQGSVQDLAGALQYVGPVAANLGIDVEHTTGTLALFASQGQIGMKAGTGLRGVLMALTSPTKQVAEVMKQYNVEMFDGQGKFIGMAAAAQQLNKAFLDRTDAERSAALGAIFGNEQITAATVLYKAGAKGVDEWTDKVNEAGYAAGTAAIMQNNLRGDVEKLGGSFDTAMINTGAAANGVLRDMVQILTSLVDWYGALPAPVQGTALAVGIGTAAVLVFGGAILITVPKIAAFRLAMQTLTTEMPRAAGAAKGFIGFLTGPWAIAIGAAVLVVTAFASEQAHAAQRTEAFGETLDKTTNQVTSSTREMVKANLAAKDSFLWMESDSTYDAAKKLGIGLDVVTDAAMGNVKALQFVKKALDVGTVGTDSYKKALKESGLKSDDFALAQITLKKGVSGSSDSINEAIRVAKLKQEADTDSTGTTKVATEAEQDLAKATDEATKAQEEWAEMVSESDASFVDLGGALDTIIQKNQDVAQKTADSTKSSKDSWQDYYDGVSFSLDKYLKELQSQVDAQSNWEKNMILLSGRASKGLIDELAKLGPEGAPLVAKLVTASDEELSKMEGLYAQRAGDATGAFTETLSASEAVIKAAAGQVGQKAADEIATKLANGTSTIAQIINEYGLKIEGMNPVIHVNTAQAQANLDAFFIQNENRLRLFGSRVANGRGGGGITFGDAATKADGGKINFYANGGAEHHIAQFARAGTTRVWAEPETEGEWYIPAAKSKRQRSTQVLAAAAAEFGYQLVPAGGQHFADGGRSGATTTTGGDVSVQVDVHPGPDLSEEHIGRAVASEVNDILRKYL